MMGDDIARVLLEKGCADVGQHRQDHLMFAFTLQACDTCQELGSWVGCLVLQEEWKVEKKGGR